MGRPDNDQINVELIDTKAQLLKKQEEIAILQSLTTEFAMVRDKEDLMVITRDKLRDRKSVV